MATNARSLGPRASFWVAAAVVMHTLWTSAAPAVTYPLYASLWHLTPTVTTAIFAVYPISVVAMLLLFGNLSDHIGRRRTMLVGLAASLTGVLLFAIAPSVGWVFAGRIFMGFGVGLSAGPSTAAMVEFAGAGQSKRASAIATAATAVGVAMATLVGGALIEYAPWPMHLNFWVLFAVLAALFGATWFLPRHGANFEFSRWRPAGVGVPKGMGRVFAISTVAVSAGFAFGALILSLGAQIARDLIGSSSALINGSAIAVFAVVSATVAIGARAAPAERSIVLGGVASAAGMGFLVLAVAQHALPIFLAGVAATGAAYSLLFLGGLTLVNAHAPADRRAGTISAVYLIAYLAMGVIALLLGVSATAWGLAKAIDLGAPAIGVLGVAGAALVLAGRAGSQATAAAAAVAAR